MELIIRNNNTDLKSEKFDIIISCENSSEPKVSCIDFKFDKNLSQKLSAKFFLNNDTIEIDEFNFHHFENTNLLFFRFVYQWGIIDLKTRELKRNIFDKSLDFPFFYLHENCILIVDDLFAETITLNGDTIDKIGNEQPHEITEFEDYFEFDIIGVEKRKLNKKATANNSLAQLRIL